jgi:hypothetical protein
MMVDVGRALSAETHAALDQLLIFPKNDWLDEFREAVK